MSNDRASMIELYDSPAVGPSMPPTMNAVIAEIRAGVSDERHRLLVDTLRCKYGATTYQLQQLKLPGPVAPAGGMTPPPILTEERARELAQEGEEASREYRRRIATAAGTIAPGALASNRFAPLVAEVARREEQAVRDALAIPAAGYAAPPAALPLSPLADRIRRAANGELDRAATVEERRQATGSAAGRRAQPMDLSSDAPVVGHVAPVAALPGASRKSIGAGMVAGAAAEAQGRLYSWAGRGRLHRRDLLAALADAHLPADWAPAEKTNVAHLGRAVGQIALAEKLTPRSLRGHKGMREGGALAHWQLGTVSGADVGQAYGAIEATATLYPNYTYGQHQQSRGLVVEGRQDLVRKIAALYDQMRADESYDAGDVTDWLQNLIVRHFAGARLGVCFWISSTMWPRFEALAMALRARRWGSSWMAPGIPVATTDELTRGLVSGLRDELRTLAAEVAATKPKAPCKPQLDAAAVIQSRAQALGQILGREGLEEVEASVRKLCEAIRSRTSDADQRAAMLELV